MRPIYDWPVEIKPMATVIIAPSHTIDGALSQNGFESDVQLGGARCQMRLSFAPTSYKGGHMASWLMNQARGAVFRVPVFNTPQLAKDATIEANEALYGSGIPFSTGEPFSTGYGFSYDPFVTLVADVLAGNNTIVLDVSNHPTALKYGNVFGLGRSTYIIDEIDFEGNLATIKCRPPFRRNYTVADDDLVTLRPKMLGQIAEPNKVIEKFNAAQMVAVGEITLNEFVDARFL